MTPDEPKWCGTAFDVDEWEVRVAQELRCQVFIGDQGAGYSREVCAEEAWDGRGGVGFEGGEEGRGPEERACESFVEAGDGDKHEGAGGPDVKVIWRDREVSFLVCNGELAPQAVDVLLLKIHAAHIFIIWNRAAECAPSAPMRKSKSVSSSFERRPSSRFASCVSSNHAFRVLKFAPVNLW